MAYFKSPFSFPSLTQTTPGVNVPPATEPVDVATLGIPSVGTGEPQLEGGLGNPYVGSGWTNLSNFLNKDNVNWGNQQQGEPAPMDMANGRSQQQSDFENWMWKAGGSRPAPEKPQQSEEQNSSGGWNFNFPNVGPMFPNGVDMSHWGYHPMGNQNSNEQAPQDTSGEQEDSIDPFSKGKGRGRFPTLDTYFNRY